MEAGGALTYDLLALVLGHSVIYNLTQRTVQSELTESARFGSLEEASCWLACMRSPLLSSLLGA
jgi:hypothetical protein